VSRFAAAAALACTIVLVSTPSHARGFKGFKAFSSAPKAAAAARPAAAGPATAAPGRSSVFVAVGGGRPAAAAGAPQQAVGDPSSGSSLYQPVSADAKPSSTDTEAPKQLAAAPSTECTVKEPAKETVAAQEPAKAEPPKTELPKTEPTRTRSAFLVPVVNKHPLAPAPRRTVVCFVQRDGTCAP